MQKAFTETQRNIIADKLIELGNLTVVALVVSQLLGDTVKPQPLIAGTAGYLFFAWLATKIMKGGAK